MVRRGLTRARRCILGVMARRNDAELNGVFKSLDSAWTVLLVDPLIRPMLPHVAGWRFVTPLRLTVGAHVLGLVAATAFLQGWLVVGAMLFEARFVLDCLDGKVARLRDETSELGAILDSHGDRVVILLTFVAAAASAHQPWLAVAIAATYMTYFSMRELRNEVYDGRGLQLPIDHLATRGIVAVLRSRRITPLLTTVDVEHLVLFVTPLAVIVGIEGMTPALAVASFYFGANALRFGMTALRLAGNSIDASA